VGKLIQWPKKSGQAETEEPLVQPREFAEPRDILKAVFENAESIDQLVVLWTDHDGNLGLLSNLNGVADNLLFLEGAKHKMVAAQFDLSGIKPQGGGTA
jgi:hypothetical protein